MNNTNDGYNNVNRMIIIIIIRTIKIKTKFLRK